MERPTGEVLYLGDDFDRDWTILAIASKVALTKIDFGNWRGLAEIAKIRKKIG